MMINIKQLLQKMLDMLIQKIKKVKQIKQKMLNILIQKIKKGKTSETKNVKYVDTKN